MYISDLRTSHHAHTSSFRVRVLHHAFISLSNTRAALRGGAEEGGDEEDSYS